MKLNTKTDIQAVIAEMRAQADFLADEHTDAGGGHCAECDDAWPCTSAIHAKRQAALLDVAEVAARDRGKDACARCGHRMVVHDRAMCVECPNEDSRRVANHTFVLHPVSKALQALEQARLAGATPEEAKR